MAKKVAKTRKAAAKARGKEKPPADAHTYGDGAHTIGNLVIHGLGHYNAERKMALGEWLRKLAMVVEGEVEHGETFAARFNVRNL